MSIGETLANARRDAGLTVTQVSERTRIRETIIRAVERDDFIACGGDFYARGDIRSIALAVGADPGPLIGEYDETLRAPEEITAAEALAPTMAIRPVPRRKPNWTAVLAVLLLAAVAVLGYHLATSPGRTSATATGYSLAHPHRRARPPATPAPRPTPTPTPAPTPAPTSLTPVTVVAFGPGGPSTGDNPQQAAQAIDGSAAAGTGWQTNWYLSPDFGNLQAGTGLLLDLGQTETVTSVQVTLGPTPGATLQLRAGSAPALADLATVARATDAGGVLRLRPAAPVRGRYLLLWFTRLPPDSSGTYQAFVYKVTVQGQA